MVHKMLLITWLFHICPICWAWVYLHKIKSHKRKQMHFHEEHQTHLKTLLDTFMTPNSKMAGFFLKFSLYIFLLVWRTYTTNITYDLELQWKKELARKWKFCHYLLPHFLKSSSNLRRRIPNLLELCVRNRFATSHPPKAHDHIQKCRVNVTDIRFSYIVT